MGDEAPPAARPNEWTARVWGAMSRDCPRKPAECAGAFLIVCADGWPYTGTCEACGKSWAVMPDRIGKFAPIGNTGAPKAPPGPESE